MNEDYLNDMLNYIENKQSLIHFKLSDGYTRFELMDEIYDCRFKLKSIADTIFSREALNKIGVDYSVNLYHRYDRLFGMNERFVNRNPDRED